ncbi:MAG: 3,4-dihydroxyphenylacetate 2,3-dioxygenase [Alicyclobacillaceae bacterium]|nr:3,4-dihydroxyphenylacetate 2,3-dioxygenase [Alicyclobacillaceae bacterium]
MDGHPFGILRAGHAELLVTDIQKAKMFYVDVLGFVVTEETDTQLYLRGVEERLHHSLVLTVAERPAVGHLSFRVTSNKHVESLYQFYQSLGCSPVYCEPGEESGQGLAVRVRDPFGFPLEFYAEMEPAECLLQKYHLHRGAAPRRIDHFNCFVDALQDCCAFWQEQMGFCLTEYVETDDEPRELRAVWMRRKPNVHDLALMRGSGPRLHHVGFWMDDILSIIHTCDILGGAELHEHIERGPGRHGISNAFFLYLRDPDGHRVELYTSDYLTIDPDLQPIRWSATDPRRQTLWGHPTPDSWWKEASPVMDLVTKQVVEPTGLSVPSMGGYIK